MLQALLRGKVVVLLPTLALGLLLLAATGAGSKSKAKYVGVKKCKTCHKSKKRGNQFGQWQNSKHANAFKALASEEAKKIAKEKGIADPQKDAACLKCHVTGYGLPAEEFASSFNKEDGVQCETCHGPGSLYKKNKVMKSHEAALAAGLIVPDETVCVKCHNKESPNFKGFCFAHFYKKIMHRVPGKKHEPKVIKCTCDKKEDLKLGE